MATSLARVELLRRPVPASRPAIPAERDRRPAPFVKWVGGKGKLLGQLEPLLPPGARRMRHVEPFVGGGALFFHRRPQRALLCDVNPNLVNTYVAVRDELENVVAHLEGLADGHDADRYYAVRERYNARVDHTRAERAAMFIYLNKTCFNGLHRVNRRGEFNVPAGRYKNPRILDVSLLAAAREALRGADIQHASFESLLATANPGDFVYFDPPYEPVNETSSFTSYATDGFSREDQIRLRDVYRELDRRGCKLMLSNSDVPFIRDIYDGYRVDVVAAPRAVNCKPDRRGPVAEVVVRNY